MEENLIDLMGKDMFVIFCGDFNSRTGNEQPVDENIVDYLDLNVTRDANDITRTALRYSKDKFINGFGNSLLDFCYVHDLVIMNGYCKGDPFGDFTYISPHGSSVIDYFIVSDELRKSLI